MNTTQLSPLVDGEYTTSAAIDNVPIQELWKPSRHTLFVFDTIVLIVITGIVCVFGVMANIVSIIVFYRQGPMSSSPMVVLTGLAVTDLCVSIFGVSQVTLKILEWYVGQVVSGWAVRHFFVVCADRPALVVIQVTCLFMTLLTLERAVSVIFPFKVKAVFTPRRSLAAMVAIFVIAFVLYIPALTQYKAGGWFTQPYHPVPFRGVVPSDIFPQSVHDAEYSINGVVIPFSCVFIVVVCNVIIAWKVRSSQRFRKSKGVASTTTGGGGGDGELPTTRRINDAGAGEKKEMTSSKGNNPSSVKDIKDRKLLRMIVVVAGVFLVCFSLGIISTIVLSLALTVYVDYSGEVGNMVGSSMRLLQNFNSCINAVIYFNMSARYKEELMLLCGKKTR